MAEELQEIQVQFITKLQDAIVPDTPFSVPVRLTRYGLSGVVNHLLGQDPPRPFDFFIDGKFLRTSLAQYLQANKVSAESVLVLEYVEALPEPQTVSSNPHPDWVSSLDGSHPSFILSGCYDNQLRVWSSSALLSNADKSTPIATGSGHTGPIKSVCWVKSNSDSLQLSCATASKDRTIRTWQFSADSNSCICTGIGRGHTDSVDSIASAPNTNQFVSAGWDGKLMVWQPPADPSQNQKKRKGQSGATAAQELTPVSTLEGHSNSVTAVCWPDALAVYSGSHDHTVKQWDPQSAQCVRTWHGKQVVTAIDFSLLSNCIATAHNDKAVRVLDPRSKDGDVIKLTLSSHQQWVSSVSWSTSDANILASASYDGKVKLWDLRSSIPLHTISAHTDKALSVAFHPNAAGVSTCLVSGGADKQLQVHNIATSS